jgi:hypothetical protein
MPVTKLIFSASAESPKKPRKARSSSPKTMKKGPKKTKDKKTNNKQPEVAPKKRGRPTNAELAAKAREKREAETALRKELLERQKAAAVSGSITTPEPAQVEYDDNDEKIYPEYKTDFTSKVKDPNWIPPWPIFMPGQAVYTEMYGIRYEGTVWHDNVESAMIRVNWKDGSSQFAAKMNLKPILKKSYKKVYSARRSEHEEK